jgi:hypothetical protein
VIFEGPPGTGKSQIAKAFPALLYGVNAVTEYKLVELRERDVIDGGAGGASQVAEQFAEAALDGALLIEDAEWVSRGNSTVAVEVGRAFLRVAQANPGKLMIIMTGRPNLKSSLIENSELRRAWLNQTDVNDVTFEQLSIDELMEIFGDLQDQANTGAEPQLLPRVRSMLQDLQKKDDFANAHAVHRIFDEGLKRAKTREVPRGQSKIMLTLRDFRTTPLMGEV